MFDECEYLDFFWMYSIESDGGIKEVDCPLCKLEMEVRMMSDEYIFKCPYSSRYCFYKDICEHEENMIFETVTENGQ